jgi:hypothetical protein
VPLVARRERLQAVLAEAPARLLFSEHMDGQHGEAMFRRAIGWRASCQGADGALPLRSAYRGSRC